MWRQLSASTPITPLPSDQKLSSCRHLARTSEADSSLAVVSDRLSLRFPYRGCDGTQLSQLAGVWGGSDVTASQ